jgi:hypothetical protein
VEEVEDKEEGKKRKRRRRGIRRRRIRNRRRRKRKRLVSERLPLLPQLHLLHTPTTHNPSYRNHGSRVGSDSTVPSANLALSFLLFLFYGFYYCGKLLFLHFVPCGHFTLLLVET